MTQHWVRTSFVSILSKLRLGITRRQVINNSTLISYPNLPRVRVKVGSMESATSCQYACDTCSTHFYIIAAVCSFVYLRNCIFCHLSLSAMCMSRACMCACRKMRKNWDRWLWHIGKKFWAHGSSLEELQPTSRKELAWTFFLASFRGRSPLFLLVLWGAPRKPGQCYVVLERSAYSCSSLTAAVDYCFSQYWVKTCT